MEEPKAEAAKQEPQEVPKEQQGGAQKDQSMPEESKKGEPKMVEPKKEEPKKEEPKIEEPKKEEPKKEEPKKEEPKIEEPKKEEPKKEEPKKEEPKKEEPKKEQPKKEEPKKEEPKKEEPKKEEPKVERPPSRPQPQPQLSKRAATPSGRQSSAARGPVKPVHQDPVDADVREWMKVKQDYNKFIRSSSPRQRLHQIHRGLPKYCMGKRLDEEKGKLSSAFRGKPIRNVERLPYPHEARKLNPWKKNEQVAVGAVYHVVAARDPNDKHPVMITFCNGGDITYLENDPREIGYFARQVAAKKISPKPTLFLSNSRRDLRFGTDETAKTFVHKQAQAPGPGYYKLEDPWEKSVRRLREESKHHEKSATGKPCFGSSAGPRLPPPAEYDGMPGPGQYEIP